MAQCGFRKLVSMQSKYYVHRLAPEESGTTWAVHVKGEPTELCDGNYHRNKTIIFGQMASHPFIERTRRYMLFPLRDYFPIENVLLFV